MNGKHPLLPLAAGNFIPGKTKVYSLEYLVSILKMAPESCPAKVLLLLGNRAFLFMCSSVPFAPQSLLIFFDSHGNFYLLFLYLGSTIPENARILSEILNVYSKTKVKSAGNVLTKSTEKRCKIPFVN